MFGRIRKFFIAPVSAPESIPSPQSHLQIRHQQLNVERFDVTPFAKEFDLNWLEAVKCAPVWMSRAERLMLFSLTLCLRPRRYLEIGAFLGGSALVVGSALDALKSDGRMYLVEPEPKISHENWQKIAHRADLFEGYSPDILHEVAGKAVHPFDLVLIDGDHTYDGAKRDADGVLPYVACGGYILVHDGFFPDVRRAIDQFVDEHTDRIIDYGLMTREVTTHTGEDGFSAEWGGLRMLYVVA